MEERERFKHQFDTDLSPDSIHNKKASLERNFKFDPDAEVYRDEDGCIRLDKFGQPL